jgi:hypothetical protein
MLAKAEADRKTDKEEKKDRYTRGKGRNPRTVREDGAEDSSHDWKRKNLTGHTERRLNWGSISE